MPDEPDEPEKLPVDEWIVEGAARLAEEVECMTDHVAIGKWSEVVLHLRSLHRYAPILAEAILTHKMTTDEVREMIKVEIQEQLRAQGVDPDHVIVTTNFQDIVDAMKAAQIEDEEIAKVIEGWT